MSVKSLDRNQSISKFGLVEMNLLMMNVEDIAKVFSGVSFRGKLPTDPEGEVAVYQLRDVNRDIGRLEESSVFIKKDAVNSRYLLKRGDLLFVSKGAENQVVYYEDDSMPAVASSAFFVIRVKSDAVKPCYLQWFLNLDETQNHFKQHHGGTYTPAIRKDVLAKLALELPDLSVQEKICRIHELQTAEQEILGKMREQRRAYLTAQLTKKIKSI